MMNNLSTEKFKNTQKRVRERLSRWLLSVNKEEFDRKRNKAIKQLKLEILNSSLIHSDGYARFSDIKIDTLYYCEAFFIDKEWIMNNFKDKIKL